MVRTSIPSFEEERKNVLEDAIQFIKERKTATRDFFQKIRPQDLPLIFERLSKEERLPLLLLLPDEVLVESITKLPQEFIKEIATKIDRNKLIRVASQLPADELSDLINSLPSNLRRTLLQELPYWKVKEVIPLLHYSQDSAGGLMTNRIPIFYKELKVGKVIEKFNILSKLEEYDTNQYIYSVDKTEHLDGVGSVKDILIAPRAKKLKDVIQRTSLTVKPGVDQEDVAKMFARHDLVELPVVDDKRKLLGTITVDDIIDVVIHEGSEDLEKFGGLTTTITAPYLAARVTELVKKRAVWLIFLCLIETITATVLSVFQEILATIIILSFFIPLLIGAGGNVGSQSSAFILRGLATGDVRISDFTRVLVKESAVSALLGLTLTPVAYTIAFIITRNHLVSFTVSFSIIGIIFIASVVGALLPMFAAKLRIDPATVSAPFITTVVDIVGLMLYFQLARVIIGL